MADVFAAFAATGSAYGVAGAFAKRKFPKLPTEVPWQVSSAGGVSPTLGATTY